MCGVWCSLYLFTVFHHIPNSLGQFHQYGGANSSSGVTSTPGVSLSSQDHVTICSHRHMSDVQWRKENKYTVDDLSKKKKKVSPTRISESFDDSKHIVDLPVDQHVVHLHSDVLAASQSVRHWGKGTLKTTLFFKFRAFDRPRGIKKN